MSEQNPGNQGAGSEEKHSHFSPKEGLVAAGAPSTAKAGQEILSQGGNAVDAAIGATLAAFVAEPVLTGPFGGGFATLARGGDAEVHDFFAEVPGRGLGDAKTQEGLDFHGVDIDFGATKQSFHVGRGAAAASLMLPGLMTLHKKRGKLAFDKVVAPAVRMARDGITLSPAVAEFFQILSSILELTPGSKALFAPTGTLAVAGDTFANADLSALLERYGAGDSEPARDSLLRFCGAPAGRITEEDLNAVKPLVREPLRVSVGEYQVILNPPPSSGGLLIGFGLRLLEHVPASIWQEEYPTYMAMTAAMAISTAARAQVLSDALENPSDDDANARLGQAFLGDDYINAWREPFLSACEEGPAQEGLPVIDLGGTTHISVIDTHGMACAITTSNGEGCGHVVPGTGAMANNFLGEEDLHPKGFHTRPAGTPLTSMMSPTVVLKGGAPFLALGTGGSNRIRTVILQVLVHHLIRGLSLEDAVNAPRLHYEGDALFIEHNGPASSLSADTIAMLHKRVPEMVVFEKPNMFFGGVHAVGSGGHGIGDPRRGGVVLEA